jgi:hypothetical protein
VKRESGGWYGGTLKWEDREEKVQLCLSLHVAAGKPEWFYSDCWDDDCNDDYKIGTTEMGRLWKIEKNK